LKIGSMQSEARVHAQSLPAHSGAASPAAPESSGGWPLLLLVDVPASGVVVASSSRASSTPMMLAQAATAMTAIAMSMPPSQFGRRTTSEV